MFWIGLTVGVSIGVVAGMVLMTLLVIAGREPVEDHADALADDVETWLRDQR